MTKDEVHELVELALQAQLVGPEAREWLERLAPERDRLAAAVRFLAENGEEDAAVEVAAGIWRLWALAGELRAGRELLAAALDRDHLRPSRALALALYGDGVLAFREGAQEQSRARNEAALEIARAVGDQEAESLALVGLSRVAFRDGDYDRVRALGAQGRELTRTLDSGAAVVPLHMQAAGARLAGDLDEAVDLYVESLELNRALGDVRMVGVELHNLGHVELHRGNLGTAERYFVERRDVVDEADPYERAMRHLNEAALAFARGDRERAAELLRRTESVLDDAGIVLDPDDAFEVGWLRERVGDRGR